MRAPRGSVDVSSTSATHREYWHGVFVPAVMSVGLLFSIATLLRDALRWVGGNSLERRAAIGAAATASWVVGESHPDPDAMGILPRLAYLVSAGLFTAASLYVAVGSVANFLHDGGYVSDIGWLLGLALGLALVLLMLGVTAFLMFWGWPDPPHRLLAALRAGPFTSVYDAHGVAGPSWSVTTGFVTTATITTLVTLMVGTGRSIALEIDRPISTWLVEIESLDRLAVFDAFGATWIALALVVLVGVSTLRCRVLAWSYPAAVAAGFMISWLLREVIERPRPTGFGVAESFPSGHMVQAALIAGLVPLAAWVLTADRRAAVVSTVLLWLAVGTTAVHRIHVATHWPLDVVAGAGLGLTIVLAVHWAVAHGAWHHQCRRCPWSPRPAEAVWSRLLIHLTPGEAHRIGTLGRISAVGAAASLLVATLFVGIPADPEGYGLTSALAVPVQLTLAVIVLLAGLAAQRWRAKAAVAMAVAASGLGVYAAVQYAVWVSVTLTAMLLVPAVLTWVAWQRDETIGRIAGLAVVSGLLTTGTWFGATAVHAAFFGPTHPESTVVLSELNEAEWVWVGGVTDRQATLVAGGLPDETPLTLSLWADGRVALVVDVEAGENGLIRHTWFDLDPATTYGYAVTETDESLPTVVDGSFTTFATGPQDLTVVLGACARTGSNGSVFDAMAAEEPDLYIGVGDLHYSNLASTSPSDHINEYHRMAIQPAQAQLFRTTPFAYVWDDHDYGPNDSGASSPSREAVSLAYRQAVPNYEVDPDPSQSIAQAFTIGRVRFVITDTRSMRTDVSMLSERQLAWLVDELVESAPTHAVVVWVNPTPWVATADGGGSDDWSAFPEERRAIADAIAAAEIDNLVMVSGDAHMLAIDDGSNTGFVTSEASGFPLLHVAALDRPGSVKGGPYSEGAFPGPGQYGLLRILDDGGTEVTVVLSGKNWRNETIVSLELTVTSGG